jgi:hypothetical protein
MATCGKNIAASMVAATNARAAAHVTMVVIRFMLRRFASVLIALNLAERRLASLEIRSLLMALALELVRGKRLFLFTLAKFISS